MFNKVNLRKMFLGILMLVFSAAPQLSYADWDHHYYHWHEHPHWGIHVHYIPGGYRTVWVGGARYYYSDGLYYSYMADGEYVIVNPPLGAYVDVIPPDFQPVFINGRTYYTDNGVYYILTPYHGYRVVAPPVVYEQPAPVMYAPPMQPAPVVAQNSFTINVPNSSGGYTPVIISRSGNGYVGPQGEYYPSFPTVAQLRAMYGK